MNFLEKHLQKIGGLTLAGFIVTGACLYYDLPGGSVAQTVQNPAGAPSASCPVHANASAAPGAGSCVMHPAAGTGGCCAKKNTASDSKPTLTATPQSGSPAKEPSSIDAPK